MIIVEMLEKAAQARREDRLHEARHILVEAVDLCRAARPAVDLGRSLAALGQIERDLNHLDAALHCYTEAVAIFQQEYNRPRLAHALRHAADLHRELERLAAAEPEYEEALRIYRSIPTTPPLDIANTLRGYALLKEDLGQEDTAVAYWEEARDLYARVGIEAGVQEAARRIDLLTSGPS